MDTETFEKTKRELRTAMANVHETQHDKFAGAIVVTANYSTEDRTTVAASMLVAGTAQTIATMVHNTVAEIISQRPDVAELLLAEAFNFNPKDLN